MNQSLAGKKIAILVENKFIPEEIEAYRTQFAELGAQVDFFSRIWYGDYRPGHPDWKAAVFYSDVDPSDNDPFARPQPLEVPEQNDVSVLLEKLDDYAALLMAANYVSVRLRWAENVPQGPAPADAQAYVQSAPVAQLFAKAMASPRLVKGALCHGLWILTPYPELLRGRRVTCHTVVMADVLNCGAQVQFEQLAAGGPRTVAPVVTDGDLVTGFDKHQVLPYIQAVAAQVVARASQPTLGGASKKVLVVVSEWGFWGEELVGPLEVFDARGYTSVLATPTGRRPRALPPSMDPQFQDPPLGKSVTSPAMAEKVKALNDPANPRLDAPRSLAGWLPERPYWSDQEVIDGLTSPLRKWEDYYRKRADAQAQAVAEFDALLIVGGSGPMIDLVNNYRVHDLILGFLRADKPIAAECYGVACLAQAREFDDARSIIWGKHVTGHAKEYDYKDLTGVLDPETGQILTREPGNGDRWVNFGPPFYTLEYMLRDATGPDGQFHGNVGRATSVIVDYPFITGRSTPDAYLTGEQLVQVLEHGLRRYGW